MIDREKVIDGDLISRKAAIDALHQQFADGFEEDRWWNSAHVLFALEGLPSAQPEIIRCKDCMHNGSFDTDCPIKWTKCDDDFCSYAERRTNDER